MTTIYAYGQAQVRVNQGDPTPPEGSIIYAHATGRVVTATHTNVCLRVGGIGQMIQHRHARVVLPWVTTHHIPGMRAPPELSAS